MSLSAYVWRWPDALARPERQTAAQRASGNEGIPHRRQVASPDLDLHHHITRRSARLAVLLVSYLCVGLAASACSSTLGGGGSTPTPTPTSAPTATPSPSPGPTLVTPTPTVPFDWSPTECDWAPTTLDEESSAYSGYAQIESSLAAFEAERVSSCSTSVGLTTSQVLDADAAFSAVNTPRTSQRRRSSMATTSPMSTCSRSRATRVWT